MQASNGNRSLCKVQPEVPGRPDLAREVGGPFVVTFTARLPFPIGVPNQLGHTIWLAQPFLDGEYTAAYQRPFVNIRVFDLPQSGLRTWAQGTHEALKYFYDFDLEDDASERYGEDVFREHNQWVTLETPWGAIQDYESDPFHRCLNLFNLFLQATLIITRDIRIRLVSSHDLRPLVIVGAWPKGGGWRQLSDMYMHPGATPESLLTTDKPFDQDQLNGTLSAIVTQKPFIYHYNVEGPRPESAPSDRGRC